MSGGVTPLRPGDRIVDLRSPSDRLVELQKAMNVEVELVECKLVHAVRDMANRLHDASALPLKPGIKDEFRRLAETMAGVATRVEAIRGRG